MWLSFPATASRLMSAMSLSFSARCRRGACAFVSHALCRMKPGVAPVLVVGGPVRGHPRGPAQLTETAQANRRRGTGWNRQFGVAIELLAIVEEQQVGERFAEIAGRQEANILREIDGID